MTREWVAFVWRILLAILRIPAGNYVAVKRLEKEWFQSELDELPYSQMVCDIAVRETNTKFNARIVRVSNGILRQVRLAYRFVRQRVKYPRLGKQRLLPITKRLKISAYGGRWFYSMVLLPRSVSNSQGISR